MGLLYESLLNSFKHSNFKSKTTTKVLISPDKVFPLAYHLILRTAPFLHNRLKTMGAAKEVPSRNVTESLVRKLLVFRRGSLYASVLTSIDFKGIFHGDQFALAVQRLGIHSDLQELFTDVGYYEFGTDARELAPFYWAQALAEEFRSLKEDILTPVLDVLRSELSEAVTLEDLDNLVEAASSGKPKPGHNQWRASLEQGYSQLKGEKVNTYRRLGATLLRTSFIKLPDGQTMDGAIEAFIAQLLSSPQKVTKALRGVSFADVKLSPTDISRVFSKADVKLKLEQVFRAAYDAGSHVLSIPKVYINADIFNFYPKVIAAVKTTPTGRGADFSTATALFAAIVGLFVMFMGEGNLPGVVVSGDLKQALTRKGE